MNKKVFFVIIAILIIGFITPSVYAWEDDERSFAGSGKGEAMIFDLILLRPAGIAACTVGFVSTFLSFPFVAGGQNGEEVVGAFLTEPGDYTFVRPLGHNN